MTIQEKISRYQLIPKLIANLEENRARILNGKAVCYDKNDSSAGTPGNTADAGDTSGDRRGVLQRGSRSHRYRKDNQAVFHQRHIGEEDSSQLYFQRLQDGAENVS